MKTPKVKASNGKKLRALQDLIDDISTTSIQGGIEDDGYRTKGGLSVIDYGMINELGERPKAWKTGGRKPIPSRSFLRATLVIHKEKYKTRIERILQGALSKVSSGGSYNVGQAFERLGAEFVEDVRARIRAGIAPPNRPSTIKRKKSSTPLIETGRLLRAITYTMVKVKK